MSERSKQISKLLTSNTSRISYIRAKLDVLIPSQIRALRLKHDSMTQKGLAKLADMAQPRISAMERPGATKFNLETLVRLASALKVGLVVKFVPFSEMLGWENSFSQDQFDVVRIDNDTGFLTPDLDAAADEIPSMVYAAAFPRGADNRNVGGNIFRDLHKRTEQMTQQFVFPTVITPQGESSAYGDSISSLG